MSAPVVIADASCLIALTNIGHLHILGALFGSVTVTQQVAAEYGQTLPDWISIQPVAEDALLQHLRALIDEGEASSIAYACGQPNSLLIVDERRGRRIAKQFDLSVTGTLGILLLAKQRGLIPAVKPVLNALSHIKFRMSATAMQEIVQLANEL